MKRNELRYKKNKSQGKEGNKNLNTKRVKIEKVSAFLK